MSPVRVLLVDDHQMLVVLTASHDPEQAVEAARAGAAGWVSRESSIDALTYALRCANRHRLALAINGRERFLESRLVPLPMPYRWSPWAQRPAPQ